MDLLAENAVVDREIAKNMRTEAKRLRADADKLDKAADKLVPQKKRGRPKAAS